MVKEPPKIKIQNVVATSTIASSLDLKALMKVLHRNAKYDSNVFPGLIYQIKKPKTATLIFKSGKIVCTGANSILNAKRAIGMVIDRLIGPGHPLVDPAHIMEASGRTFAVVNLRGNIERLVAVLDCLITPVHFLADPANLMEAR